MRSSSIFPSPKDTQSNGSKMGLSPGSCSESGRNCAPPLALFRSSNKLKRTSYRRPSKPTDSGATNSRSTLTQAHHKARRALGSFLQEASAWQTASGLVVRAPHPRQVERPCIRSVNIPGRTLTKAQLARAAFCASRADLARPSLQQRAGEQQAQVLSGARIVIVAAAVGACTGAALAPALTKRVTAGEEAVATPTSTPSAAAITAPAHETHFFVRCLAAAEKRSSRGQKKVSINPSQQARRTGRLIRYLDGFFAR